MAKQKKIFRCSKCEAQYASYMGRCTNCEEWGTIAEEIVGGNKTVTEKKIGWMSSKENSKPKLISEIEAKKLPRLKTNNGEFDRVLGGGIVPGSLILLGGQPGIGKSTLLLQVALNISATVLYVSGEESEEQLKMRADRLGYGENNCLILAETNTEKILQQTKKIKPALLIIDSIQTLASPHVDAMPGGVSQVRECAGELQRFAKEMNIPILIIGHINKDGALAGPKLLEHIVDTVLQFEGDRQYFYRLLRAHKNRFGSTDEMGIYAMDSTGLREVENPSELLISEKEDDLSGNAVAAMVEGMRPMLIEAQALVATTVYPSPQRVSNGFDTKRLNMLLAVLEKRGGLPFAQNDVFLNIAGGLRVVDPATDLAIVAALISSHVDVAVPSNVCLAGEVGLSGEVRAVNRIELRIFEAAKLGFKQIFVSKYNLKGLNLEKFKIQIVPIKHIGELYSILFK